MTCTHFKQFLSRAQLCLDPEFLTFTDSVLNSHCPDGVPSVDKKAGKKTEGKIKIFEAEQPVSSSTSRLEIISSMCNRHECKNINGLR